MFTCDLWKSEIRNRLIIKSTSAIVSKETFDTVQEAKLERSNVIVDDNETHRSN